MGTFSIWHWLVVLAVLVLVFGTKKLRNMGGDLGAAVRGFKQGMKQEDGAAATDGSTLDAPQATATEARAEEKSETSA